MRVITVAGPPSVGKTSVIVKTAKTLAARGQKLGVVKFELALDIGQGDLRSGGPTRDRRSRRKRLPRPFLRQQHRRLRRLGTQARRRHPDRGKRWPLQSLLAAHSGRAGDLRRRQSVGRPHAAQDRPDAETRRRGGDHQGRHRLAGRTRGLRLQRAARQSARERPVLQWRHRTGRGGSRAPHRRRAAHRDARRAPPAFSMPSAVCPYCIGETSIGCDHQRGNVRKMSFEDAPA